jgi:hypothetical protein
VHHGLGRPGLHHLLLHRHVGDAQLSHFGILIGKPFLGLLDQNPLLGQRSPHATLIPDEE